MRLAGKTTMENNKETMPHGYGTGQTMREASLAAPTGSAIEHQGRRRVWTELDAIKTWTARLEAELQKEPDGVIPYLQLKGISDATTDLLYAAGQVNAIRLAHGNKSQNS